MKKLKLLAFILVLTGTAAFAQPFLLNNTYTPIGSNRNVLIRKGLQVGDNSGTDTLSVIGKTFITLTNTILAIQDTSFSFTAGAANNIEVAATPYEFLVTRNTASTTHTLAMNETNNNFQYETATNRYVFGMSMGPADFPTGSFIYDSSSNLIMSQTLNRDIGFNMKKRGNINLVQCDTSGNWTFPQPGGKTFTIGGNTTNPGTIQILEDADNGNNKISLRANPNVLTDKVQTLQDITGTIYVSSGIPVALGDGGTGSNLIDPNADRIFFWDDSGNNTDWLTPGSGLTVTATTMAVSNPISVVSIAVSSANILAMHTTPKLLVSGVASNIIVPIAITVNFTYGTATYTTGGTSRLEVYHRNTTATGSEVWYAKTSNAFDLTSSGSYQLPIIGNHSTNYSGNQTFVAGDDLVAGLSLQHITGDGTAVITVMYMTIPWP